MVVKRKAGAGKAAPKGRRTPSAPKAKPKTKTTTSELTDAERLARNLAPEETTEDEALRDMIVQALQQVGGVTYLVECAKDPRSRNTFLALCGRVAQREAPGGWSGTVNVFTGVNRGPA